MSLLGGGQAIDDLDNSGNPEDEPIDSDESRSSVKIVFEDPLIVEKMPRLVIHPQAPWKTLWNIAMLLLIIFIAITVPYRIPFEDVTPPEWLYVDIIIDFTQEWDGSYGGAVVYADGSGEFHKIVIAENTLTITQRKEGVQKFVQYVNHFSGKKNRVLFLGTLQ